ncbi:MAG: hypothetical protein HFF70_03410 [Oscillospiraceae bacterium]|jgi:hypothetical protein|nr:hypothetical protein [Oscillospiraceae bacterium]
MTFTMSALARSLADCLSPELPGASFYADPNQQGTRSPALFLRQTTAKISPQPGGAFLRRLGLDLVYLDRFYTVREESRLQAAADVMDQMLETFPYAAEKDGKAVALRTYDRHWEIADSTLHYKFQLRLRLTQAEDAALMRSIQELNMEV